MNILEKIIQSKYKEVEERKRSVPVSSLTQSKHFAREVHSLEKSIMKAGSTGIIAEFKRRSPSKGAINEQAKVSQVCLEYAVAGASAISILTDKQYFGGTLTDLTEVRKLVDIPLLRKDFIVDQYQIIEAKAAGADAVLLIAAAHNEADLYRLHEFANSVGLEVLVEVHDDNCIKKIPSIARLVGINCRDLKTFKIDITIFSDMAKKLPVKALKIAESGISSPDEFQSLRDAGFDGFLIGSMFMQTNDPGKQCKYFINSVINRKS
ncbi:MAG TPA: indole-3-glycerol phosphate synthase TrpC [Bacteroidales bacterium]|nr:indole-3-glycerol phosphate synthase TrpC [Bacteroidales bacterium]